MRALLAAAALILVLVGGCGTTTEAAPPAGQSIAEQQQAIGAQPIAGYSFTIPTINAHSTLVPLGRNPDNTIQVPALDQVEQAGVYEDGPMPGETGPAVILGHVNGGGKPGIFARLNEVKQGDTVQVNKPDGQSVTFKVYDVLTVPKGDFPTAKVYSNRPTPELRLITCGGPLSGHNYLDNIVVFARQA